MGVVQMLSTVSSGKSPRLTFFPNGISLSHRTSIKTPLSDRLAYESLREDELISSTLHRQLQEGLARLLADLFWIGLKTSSELLSEREFPRWAYCKQ